MGPAIEVRLMTRPPGPMRAAASRLIRKAEIRLTSIILRTDAMSNSASGRRSRIPTAFTRISSRSSL
jgi:ribosomal protein S11